ncbi:hypothetical protein lerEdw1_020297 [Lerista edwardsae]|nr:hypothetical protein lerEdw1_020297 [Lerista edwardsae]
MSDVEENNFEGRVNVREEMEEFFPRMWKINQDKRRLMKSPDPEGIRTGVTLDLDPTLIGDDHEADHILQSIAVAGVAVILQCLIEEGTLAAEYVVHSTYSLQVSVLKNTREDLPDPNTCLGVFGLSLYTTERDLREVFSRYGPLSGVNVVYDQRTGRSRGFAFVYFERIDDSKEAMEHANGMELDGRRIRVDYSITKRAHTPTPGIYMGRPTHSGGGGGGGGAGRRRDSYYDRGYDRGYDRYEEYDYRYRCSPLHGGDHLHPIIVVIDHAQDLVPIAQGAIEEQKLVTDANTIFKQRVLTLAFPMEPLQLS